MPFVMRHKKMEGKEIWFFFSFIWLGAWTDWGGFWAGQASMRHSFPVARQESTEDGAGAHLLWTPFLGPVCVAPSHRAAGTEVSGSGSRPQARLWGAHWRGCGFSCARPRAEETGGLHLGALNGQQRGPAWSCPLECPGRSTSLGAVCSQGLGVDSLSCLYFRAVRPVPTAFSRCGLEQVGHSGVPSKARVPPVLTCLGQEVIFLVLTDPQEGPALLAHSDPPAF